MRDLFKYMFTACGLWFCQCSPGGIGKTNTGVIKLNLLYKLPSYEKIEKIELVTDSINIYYFQNCKVYELNKQYETITDTAWMVDSIVPYYVGYDTIAKTAFTSTTLVDPVFTTINLDSFIKTRAEENAMTRLIPVLIPGKTIGVSKDLEVKYYTVTHPGLDSVILSFDKSMVPLPFSYSPYLDSLHHSKLSKMELKLAMDTSVNAQYLNKFRWMTMQLRWVRPVDNAEKIRAFCEKVKDAYGRK